ncbi:aldo/keto reductase [Xenorhabdus stockiae]|uniref:aldo/keto reductase n=1 Tax=Xenorhabdus stockiae TaxID=351614 RepID=UPI003CEF27C2
MSIKKLLPSQIGFGGAPLGNMFRAIPDDEAIAIVQEVWNLGVRYFDTAPLYGSGLSEIRMGEVLSQYSRDDYVLSTKVGRIMLDEMEDPANRDFGEKGGLFEHGLKNKILNDYSEDATLRSIEDSLKRLKTDRIDIVWIHDLSQDFYGDSWLEHFNTARIGAFRALTRLREEGVIKAWGLGVNRVEPCELTLDLDEPKPDAFLLAGRYSLLDHSRALQRLMPEALEHNVDIVVGGPYSSGVLVGGEHFEYQKSSPAIHQQVAKIYQIAKQFNVDVKAAALQFSLANPAVAAVIPGSSRPGRMAEDLAALTAKVPTDFWLEMQRQGLVAVNAPLPIR